MIQVKIFVIVVLAVSMKTVLGRQTPLEKEMGKMLFCVGCKDQTVAKQLEGSLYNCLNTNFLHLIEDVKKIWAQHKTDANGCWTDMSKLIENVTANDDTTKKYHSCWEKGVPDPKVLKEKCH